MFTANVINISAKNGWNIIELIPKLKLYINTDKINMLNVSSCNQRSYSFVCQYIFWQSPDDHSTGSQGPRWIISFLH